MYLENLGAFLQAFFCSALLCLLSIPVFITAAEVAPLVHIAEGVLINLPQTLYNIFLYFIRTLAPWQIPFLKTYVVSFCTALNGLSEITAS